jgi:hypothetical protein
LFWFDSKRPHFLFICFYLVRFLTSFLFFALPKRLFDFWQRECASGQQGENRRRKNCGFTFWLGQPSPTLMQMWCGVKCERWGEGVGAAFLGFGHQLMRPEHL